MMLPKASGHDTVTSLNSAAAAADRSLISCKSMGRKCHTFENERLIYHIAVIDYLQEWNCNKKSERFLKTVVLRKNKAMLSAIEPNEYARRFLHFV